MIPSGTEGTTADVTVTTPTGSATSSGAIHYTAAVESYSGSANLQSGIYDPGRDLYYFADKSQIQVLSKSNGQWLAPISLPGTVANTQLMAISESPDGSKLAVSDFAGQAIYLLDPGNPTAVAKYPMSLDRDGFSSSFAPSGLAVTDGGIVYFATACVGSQQAALFHKLDTSFGTISDIGSLLCSGTSSDQFDRVLLSPDGSRVYIGNMWFDTTNDQGYLSTTADLTDGFGELGISADGSTLEVNTLLADENLNVENDPAYLDWEQWYVTTVSGLKLNQDGSILFQPLTDGIDMLARNTGHLLYRVQIPATPATVYDPLVVAGGTNTLALITTSGVSFIDLSSLPIGPQISEPFAIATRSRAARTRTPRSEMTLNPNARNLPDTVNSAMKLKLRDLGDSGSRFLQ